MFKRLLYIFLFLLTGVAAFAQQYPVQGSLAVASPYPANLSDYANSNIQNLALNLTLTDLTMANKRVRLKLFIQTQNATIAQSIDNISGEPLIMLDGGIPQRFTNTELAHYFRLENLQGINPDGYARSLPEGVYTIGFEVYDYFTGNKLSGRIAQTFWIIINDPPLLNSPTDKSKIADFTSGSGGVGGIIFNWTPRSTQVTNTEYEFTLCELWDPAGDPYQQFMSAIPKYQTTVANTTTLIYSLAQPSLISGYTYAWRVRAKAKAGFEDVGLYRNDGYSNLFTFRYGDPCPAPQSLALEAKTSDQISATWQSPPSPQGAESGVRYKLAYRKYSAAGQWSWAETETSDLFLTISGLEPATEYELKVGVPCNNAGSTAPLSRGRGDGGEVVYTPSQRATTLSAGKIAGIECGKEPTIDLSKQTLLTLLKVGDVVMANDFPTTISSVTGTSQGWSGEGWTKVPWLGDTRIHVTYASIKVNSDYKLIDGSFDTAYNPSGKNIGDVDQTAADITELINNLSSLTGKIDDFITKTETTSPTKAEIDSIQSIINSKKESVLNDIQNTLGVEARQKADSAFQQINEGLECDKEQLNSVDQEEIIQKPGPHASEMSSTPDCKKKKIDGNNTLKQLQNGAANAGKIVCGCPQDGIAQSFNNGDCESIKMRIEAIKAAYSKKEKVTIYKPTTLLSGKVSVDSLCFKHLYFDMSWVTKDATFDPATYKIEESTTNPTIGSGEKFWAIKYDNILEIKISQSEPDAEKKIRALAKWLFGNNNQSQMNVNKYLPWINYAIEEAKKMQGISECDEPLFLKGKEYHREGGHSNFCPCGDKKNSNYCHPSAWCASFVNWCLRKSNTTYTKSAGSQTFLNNSDFIQISEPVFGAIAVFTNLNGNGNYKSAGHVAFVIGKMDNDQILCLGGNQSNTIKVAAFSTNQDNEKMKNKLYFRGYYLPKLYQNKLKDYKTIIVDYMNSTIANQQIINLNINSTENESTR